MNVQERLLHNEIQSLGQMIQIVSYELTLLSDFMKEKFGSSFDLFREKHSQQAYIPQSNLIADSEPNSSKKINLTARKSTSPLLKLKRQHGRQAGSASFVAKRLKPSGDSSDDENMIEAVDHENFADAAAWDRDSPISEGECDDNVTITSVIGANDIPKGAQLVDFSKPKDPDEKLQGRARSTIWNKYIVSKLPDGKLFAKCPRCKNPVSCKVERLTKHYQKCVLGARRSRDKLGTSKTFSEAAIEEDDKRKVAEYIKTMNKNSAGNGEGDNNDPLETESISNKQEEGHEIVFDHSSTGGRRADPVWEYFIVLEDPETKRRTVKCKRCQVTVSSKVERVRRHFVICQELDKEGENHND